MSNADENTGLGAYFLVYALLMIGLVATVAVAFVPLGSWNLVVAMSIAFTKAILVVLIFMHVLNSPRLTWIAVFAGLIWLGIMLSLMMADYATRDWLKTRAPADMALPMYQELVPLLDNAGHGHHGDEAHGDAAHGHDAHADEAHEAATPADAANADEE